MKIAFASEDGQTISQHFGRAPHYVVLTLEGGQVTGREQRSKAHHGPGDLHGPEEHAAAEHGATEASLHNRMSAAVTDCQVVVTRGMGRPAYEGMRQAGLEVIVTDVAGIDQAAQAYLAGNLPSHPERLHH